MTQTVQMCRSNSGTVHESEHVSHKDDLRHWLMRSELINEASATRLVDWLCGSRESLCETGSMINALIETHPSNGEPDRAPETTS